MYCVLRVIHSFFFSISGIRFRRPCLACCARRSRSSMPLRPGTFRQTPNPATRSGRIGSFHAACANDIPPSRHSAGTSWPWRVAARSGTSWPWRVAACSLLSVNRAQVCSGHPPPICQTSMQILSWRAFSRRTRQCQKNSRHSSRGITRHGQHIALHFRILRAIMFPDAAQGLLRLLFHRRCDLVANPGICLGTKAQATRKFDLHRVLFPASSCIRLRALPRAIRRC